MALRLRIFSVFLAVLGAACSPPKVNDSDLGGLTPRRIFEPRLPGLSFEPCPLLDQKVSLRATCPKATSAEKTAISRAALPQGGGDLRGAEAALLQPNTGRVEILADLLAATEPAEFRKAIDQLERRADGTQDPEALTDLAAAYLFRAEALGDAIDLLFASRAARAALDLEPNYPPALFDLALAYERLLLRRAAAATWNRLLGIENDGGWATEAEAHLAKLERELALPQTRPPNTFAEERTRAIGEIFPRWARAVERGDAAERAAAEKDLGELAARAATLGDSFLDAAVRALAGPHSRDLAAAHLELFARRQSHNKEEKAGCAPGLEKLAERFRAAGSSFELEVLHLASRCAYHGLEPELASRTAAAWQEKALRSGYRFSAGLASWFRGSVAGELGDYAQAKEQYDMAIELVAGLTPELVPYLEALEASATARSGDPVAAWRQLHAALEDLLADSSPYLSPALHEAALELALTGMPELGLLYAEEEMLADLGSTDPWARCDARWLRSFLLMRIGDLPAARREHQRLGEAIAEVQNSDSRRRLEILASSLESELLLETDPAGSAQAAEKALAAYQQVSFDTVPLDLHLLLAKSLDRLGQKDRALETLDQGLTYFSSQTKKDPEISAKVRLFDRAEKMLEEKMRMELQNGKEVEAFATLEEARARLLREELGAAPASLELVQRELTPQDLFLQYFFLDDRLLVFRVEADQFALVPLEITRPELSRSVAQIWENDESSARVAKWLYSRLLQPLVPAAEQRLLISGPEELSSLPWAALIADEQGRRLVENHQILIIPSATVLLALESRGNVYPSLAGAPFLAVGDPAFDSSAAPRLNKELLQARQEAREAARKFTPSTLLEREDATVSAFLEKMASHAVVLYAGHAMADSSEPMATKLLLAPDAAHPSGVLASRDIYGKKLPTGALVILNGCETGGGYGSKIEGRLDLAHPFFAAGAGQVLLTRKSVSEPAARKFIQLFLEYLRQSGDPWSAFRAAQIASLRSQETHQRRPGFWAIYQYTGARWSSQGGGPS